MTSSGRPITNDPIAISDVTRRLGDLKASGDPLAVRSPASGEVVGQVTASTAADIVGVVRGLRHSHTTWESGGLEARIGHLLRLRDWLLANAHTLTKLVQDETGKPWQEASIEVPLSCDFINYYCRNAKSFLAGSHPRPHSLLTASKRLSIAHRPYPVVGVISAWNFPLVLPLMDCLPALLAGAAVVVKPSEVTPSPSARSCAPGPRRSRRLRSLPAPRALAKWALRSSTRSTMCSSPARLDPAGPSRSGPPNDSFPAALSSAGRTPRSCSPTLISTER